MDRPRHHRDDGQLALPGASSTPRGGCRSSTRARSPTSPTCSRRQQHPASIPNREYSLPWASGMTGIGYDPAKVGGEISKAARARFRRGPPRSLPSRGDGRRGSPPRFPLRSRRGPLARGARGWRAMDGCVAARGQAEPQSPPPASIVARPQSLAAAAGPPPLPVPLSPPEERFFPTLRHSDDRG